MSIPYLYRTVKTDDKDALNRYVFINKYVQYSSNYLIPNVIPNGNFEEWTNSSTPDKWTKTGTVSMYPSGHDGDYSCMILSDATLYRQASAGINGITYRTYVYYKVLGATTGVLSILLKNNLGVALASASVTNPEVGGWAKLVFDCTPTTLTNNVLIISIEFYGTGNLLIDSACCYPYSNILDLDYSDFATLVSGATYRYTFPHGCAAHGKQLDDPTSYVGTDSGSTFTQVRRFPRPSYVMEFPNVLRNYIEWLEQFFWSTRGDELTFVDWYGLSHQVRWGELWTPRIDGELVSGVTMTLTQCYPDFRTALAVGAY